MPLDVYIGSISQLIDLSKKFPLPGGCDVLFYGAAGTGKTQWFNHFDGIQPDINNNDYIPSTHPMTKSKYVLVSSDTGQRKLVRITDTPGDDDDDIRRRREARIAQVKPRGIVVFVDHAHPFIQQYEHDSGQLVLDRLTQHRKSLEELTSLLREDSNGIRTGCRGILICVNKFDLWSGRIHLREFSNSLRKEISELASVVAKGVLVSDPIPVSQYRRYGEEKMISFFDSVGKTWKFR